MESYDCVIVGARCAGSPLAALLARRGVRVAVVEQATFPRDTLSTHFINAQALAFLDRLGVMEKIRATGAPLVGRFNARQEDLEYVAQIPQQPGDAGGVASVRRTLLDPILAQAATEAGAELRMATKVTGLVEDQGRVRGVRVAHNGSQTTLQARLVVGARRGTNRGRLRHDLLLEPPGKAPHRSTTWPISLLKKHPKCGLAFRRHGMDG